MLAALLVAPLAWREQGSIAIGDWLHYAVAIALLLAGALLAGLGRLARRDAWPAIGGFAALAAWIGLSAAWSPLPTEARNEALLVVLYVLVLALPALTLRSPGERIAALTGIVLVLSGLAVSVGIAVLAGSPPPDAFRGGRLFYPLTYVNAQAALFLVGLWPAVVLASRRRSAVVLRAAAVGGAGAMLAGWLMTQSKGGAAGLAASAVVVFALCPARLRLLTPVAIAGAIAAAAYSPLTEPFREAGSSGEADAIRGAAAAQLLVATAAAGAGLLYALLDRRLELSSAARRAAGRAVLAAGVLAAAAGVVAFLLAVGSPATAAREAWSEFKTLPEGREEGTSSHLGELGSNRYDFWRVALGEFSDRPVVGVGGRGFSPAYLREGATSEAPFRSHSLVFDVLAENGVVGLGLLVLAAGAALLVAARRASRVPAAAALGAGAYWVAHAAVDWTWTFPAVGVPALLLLGIPLSTGRTPSLVRVPARLAGGTAALLVALVVLAPPLAAARLTERALERRGDPPSDLAWARRLDPLSVEPLLAEAFVSELPARAIAPLERAAEKEPRNLAVRYALGTAYLRAGQAARARAELLEALELNPDSELVLRALRRAR